MLVECGGNIGGAERKYADTEPGDDIQASLCRGEEHLPIRRGSLRLQQRVAATGRVDRAGGRQRPSDGFSNAKLGSVASQTFALQYSDTAGAASLQTAWVYFNSTLASAATNTCLLYYNVTANVVNLLNDNGLTWQTADTGDGDDAAEQPVLFERGGNIGGAERKLANAEPGDDIQAGLCWSQRISTCTPLMFRGLTAGGSNWGPLLCPNIPSCQGE